ncbi:MULTISPECIES: hypothetical protein [Leuconostoc]|uniref:hypothetical protein n=1 Tax=Leuconostoc TaxID=1243 RepID=UPI0002E5F331|nr:MULTISPECIES: hypothetical protein [Leuconostoc]MBB6432465.1 hypothetical protein [Leuconostoc carnosum]MDV8936393.1 hypothetical protein [Leuconostoc sp.]WLC59157.1 hypothetical protein HTZ88_03795 [Leuconostoc carnosum]WLC98526.1 hypothetical protein Q5R05_03905 [Leuconostoc carnosum]SPJ44446.1 conserved hypothetical protein [Leuconostoc carnosum]
MTTAIIWTAVIVTAIVLFIRDERKFDEREAERDYYKLIELGYPPEEAAWKINHAMER